ncbi:hypothetical protein LZ32DRAFT_267500 [Colletotrichum eremochloae]|nr:hypothetical protein LZ32DRAFT_267500 [Colletotrichum eremochloae]
MYLKNLRSQFDACYRATVPLPARPYGGTPCTSTSLPPPGQNAIGFPACRSRSSKLSDSKAGSLAQVTK